MIKVYQTQFNDKSTGTRSNSFRAAMASVIGRPLESVPPFEAYPENWHDVLTEFLLKNQIDLTIHDKMPAKGYCIVSGKTEKDGSAHACVYFNGQFFHDPHPNRIGVFTPESFMSLSFK